MIAGVLGTACAAIAPGAAWGAVPSAVPSAAGAGAYAVRNLVANRAEYDPVIVDPLLVNPWGIAIRPPGAGGHFWTSNAGSGTTTTYVGDVNGTPIAQDALKVVTIPSPLGADGSPVSDPSQPIGQVYNASASDFVISGEGISGPAKFIFASGEGTISAWTEQRDADNVLHRQTRSVITVDRSDDYNDEVLTYTGLAVTTQAADNRLYVANFKRNRVETFDKSFQPITLAADAFAYPGQGSDMTPWNVQYMQPDPSKPGTLWVAFAQKDDPWEEIDGPGAGAIAEFDTDGHFLRRLRQIPEVTGDGAADGELAAPWGMAIAPHDFGPLSDALLVANFGSGTVVGYDLTTGDMIDYLRDNAGNPIVVDGLWGLTFGNGVALGDRNALYFTAGPNGEQDGVFGSIRYSLAPEPTMLATLGALALVVRRRRN